MNNLTVCPGCEAGIGRADIEESKSNVAMNAWLPQASYPCGTSQSRVHLSTSTLRWLLPHLAAFLQRHAFTWARLYLKPCRSTAHHRLVVERSPWPPRGGRSFAADCQLLYPVGFYHTLGHYPGHPHLSARAWFDRLYGVPAIR